MSSIRGLQKTTLIDYPGKIACIIFFSSCNFRCPFCYNKDLVLERDKLPRVSKKEILNFLKSRIGILEGVVLTGGEPTLYPILKEFIKKIKNLGFLVKLDTNGSSPKILKELVNKNIIDYVAMDFKGPIKRYEKAVGVKVNKEKILESMRFLAQGKVKYEFRTTVVPEIHQEKDLIKMTKELKNLTSLGYKLPACRQGRQVTSLRPEHSARAHAEGLRPRVYKLKWFLQQFRPGNCLDPQFNTIRPYPKSFYDKILPTLRKIIPNTYLRGI